MNSDRCVGAAALFGGVERHRDVDVAMLRGFLRKARGRRRAGGQAQ